MIDWNALLQALVTSGAVATAVGIVFKRYTEKRIEHVFDKKLKEYEARLRESTELRIGIGKDRIEEYKKLSGLVQLVRKHTVDLCEKPDPPVAEISEIQSQLKELQKIIYNYSITLKLDHIYEQVHGYKVEVVALVKNIENERSLRDRGQKERATHVRENVNRSVAGIQADCQSIVDRLVELIAPKGSD